MNDYYLSYAVYYPPEDLYLNKIGILDELSEANIYMHIGPAKSLITKIKKRSITGDYKTLTPDKRHVIIDGNQLRIAVLKSIPIRFESH